MYAALRDNILTNGVQSSLKWYNAQAEGVDLEDNRSKYTTQPECWSQGGDYSYSSLMTRIHRRRPKAPGAVLQRPRSQRRRVPAPDR